MVLAEIIKIMGIISRITIIIVKTLILKTIIKTITNSPNILILTKKILKRILQRKNPMLLQATKIHWNNIMIKRNQQNIINNSRSRKLICMYVRNNLTKKVTLDPNHPINILNQLKVIKSLSLSDLPLMSNCNQIVKKKKKILLSSLKKNLYPRKKLILQKKIKRVFQSTMNL